MSDALEIESDNGCATAHTGGSERGFAAGVSRADDDHRIIGRGIIVRWLEIVCVGCIHIPIIADDRRGGGERSRLSEPENDVCRKNSPSDTLFRKPTDCL
jgi:hypothetical protein